MTTTPTPDNPHTDLTDWRHDPDDESVLVGPGGETLHCYADLGANIHGPSPALARAVAEALADRDRLAARVETLEGAGNALADELAEWGWGDFHIGQPTELDPSVVAVTEAWRALVTPDTPTSPTDTGDQT